MAEVGRVALMLALVMGGFLLITGWGLGRLLRPPARRLLIGLTLAAAAIIGMHLILQGEPTFWGWFFHPSSELAAGAIFSSTQYVVVTLLALLIGLFGTWDRGWKRLYWLIMAGLFAFLLVDEYFSLHETVLLWRYMYPLAGASIVLLTVVAWWISFRRDWPLALLILAGLGIMGFSGVALDAFSNEEYLRLGSYEATWFACRREFLGVPCQSYGFAEEFLEMAGVALILAALYSYLLGRVPKARQAHLRRVLVGGVALWLVWAVSNVLVIPTIEQVLLAERFPLVYADEDLQFLGYTHPTSLAAPGDTVTLTLYYRARRPLTEDYHVSVHAVTRDDSESVAQYDVQLGEWKYPSTAWIPGFAVRNRISLELPDDLPTDPTSYRITARVWSTETPARTLELSQLDGLPITESARQLVTPDTVVLFGQPVMVVEAVPPAPQAADYRFPGDFRLAGYDLPAAGAAGQPLPVAFWWQTGARVNIPTENIHFVHFFHENGEAYWVYDRAPFDDRFPTADWPPNVSVVDRFAIPLPEDLLPGVYTVRSGMYEPNNRDRLAVTDSSGVVATDLSVVLGTVTIAAAGE